MSAIRLDKLFTVGVVHPAIKILRTLLAVEPESSPKNKLVPILMYHSISDEPQSDVAPYYRTSTSPKCFAEQMRLLHREGWSGVSLAEALRSIGPGSTDSRKLAVLTFDDGFRDFYSKASPILADYGFTATMYLPTDFISSERRSFLGRECLTWEEVRELRARGMCFGSHTVTHPKLYELSWTEIQQELKLSKKHIEEELREEVTSFAYPYAFPQEDRAFVRNFTAMLQNCGYRDCVTTAIGRVSVNDSRFHLKRLPSNSCDDSDLFVAKLNGAYNWVSVPQRLFRGFRASRFSNPRKRL